MSVTVVDLNTHPTVSGGGTSKHDRLFYNSQDFHVWVHHSEAGFKGPMHRHSAPETFYCLRGTCYMNHPDGTRELMSPGVMIVVPAGDFYQLEDADGQGFVLWGTRSEPYENFREALDGSMIATNPSPKLAV